VRKIIFSLLGLAALAFLGFWLVYLPYQVVHAQRHPLETNPASMGVAYEDVAFPTKGAAITIRGWWMPAKDARAVLVMVHGANGNRRELHSHGLELAKFLVGAQVSVLAIDLRNHGTSGASPDGKLAMGYGEANDAIGAADYAASRAPDLPVYLMGSSMGGAAVIYAASQGARVKGLVLLDPVLDPHTTSVNFLEASQGAPRWFVAPVVWSAETFFPGDPGFHDPLATGERLTLPVLLVQDDRDPVCLPATAAKLAHANPHVTLWVSHDPMIAGYNGGWGYHTAAYAVNPVAMQAQLTKFLGVN
jgi:alpha-beta hydrolase superfamily lysophospholipase